MLLLLLASLPLLLLLSRAGEKLAVFVSAFLDRRRQVDRCPAVFPELSAVQRLLSSRRLGIVSRAGAGAAVVRAACWASSGALAAPVRRIRLLISDISATV